jgi:hypothetical protein
MEEPLKWDGTYLDFRLVEYETDNGINYGKLLDHGNQNCIYIKYNSLVNLVVIYEHIKPLFGVRMNKFHFNKKYIIYQPYEIEGVWHKEIRLSDFDNYGPLKYSLKREIRHIICFRYFLLLTNICEKNILYRDTYVISFNEKKGRSNIDTLVLSERIRNSWFPQTTIDEEICNLFKDYKDKVNCELRNLITEIILKIDKRFIWLSSEFCNRLTNIFSNVESQKL